MATHVHEQPTSLAPRRVFLLIKCGAAGLLALATLLLLLASPALAPAPSFPDVPTTHPYYVAITDLAGRAIIGGFPDGSFRPEANVIRQQFAKMIVLTLGLPVSEADTCPFSDVEQGGPGILYPDHYVAVAAAHAITVGTSPGLFSPGNNITRAQVVTMVVRAAQNSAPSPLAIPPLGYPGTLGDFDTTHSGNLKIAEFNGLIAGLEGFGTAWDPFAFATRGEVAQILHNLLGKLPEPTTTTTATSTTTTTTGPTSTTTTGPTSTTTSSSTTTTTALPAAADLLHFWWTPATDWQVENVSQLTGQQIAGPMTAYELSEFDPVEHLATVSPTDDLLVFSETPLGHNWQVVNVSQKTGQKITGAITSWRTGGSTATTADDADHLAAMSPNGALLHFWWTSQSDWLVENVSLIVGGARIAGPPTSWHAIPNASDVDHLAAMAPNGDLLVFWGPPLGQSWQVVNVSQKSGQKIAGPPVYWLYAEQSGAWADNLAAVGMNGDLLHFRWSLQADWTAHPITPSSGYKLTGSLTCWSVVMQGAIVGHLAGMSPQGELLHFWTAPAGWQVESVSQIAGGAKIAGPPTDWFTGWSQSGTTWVDRLAAADPAHSLLVFWDPQLSHNWQVINVTQKTGQKIREPVTGWLTGVLSANPVDHVAAMKRD